MFSGFVTAIRTLSILPAPGKDADDLSRSLPWFPVVGLLIGTILYAINYLATDIVSIDWPGGIALALVVVGVILSRALHLDGLADCADGFWGGHTREDRLRIMKDSSTGAFGVTAITFILLARWIAVTRIVSCGTGTALVIACVISRTVQVDIAMANPYARAEQGTGFPFIDKAKPRHLLTAIAVAALTIFCIGQNWHPLAILAVSICFSHVFGMWCRQLIGGVTGDTIGAFSEITETLVLLYYAGMTTI